MNATASPGPSSSGRPRLFRRKYLIDKPTQLRVSGWLLGGLIAIAAMYVVAMLVFLSPEALEGMESNAVRRLLLTANLAYFLFAGILIVTLAVLLSHRFVGPAYVFKNALEAMARGDYSQRLSLRKTDYMQDVAAALTAVRQAWLDRERQVVEATSRIEKAVGASDSDAALLALADLRAGVVVKQVEAAPADSPAPVTGSARKAAAAPVA